MHKEENGIVRVNSKVCIGCGYCTMACPYKAPHVSKETHTSTKCDGCYDRTEAGKKPICVEACPLRALDFGKMSELIAKYDGVNSIAPMPDPSATLPNIIIKPSPAARKPGDYTGFIANPKEV
jgi:anaerobic dimethyl sulfoxide reductase subunit B (iron-sulfur subunit)